MDNRKLLRGKSRLSPAWGRLAGVLLGYLLAGQTLAFTIDTIAEQSFLGEPLRLVFPITKEPGEFISGECIRVVPAEVRTRDGMPEILSSRISLEQTSSSSRVIVSSAVAMNDPAARITLEVGCEARLRRQYVMLFDPPAIAPTTLSAGAGVATSYADVTSTDEPQALAKLQAATAPVAQPVRTTKLQTASNGSGRYVASHRTSVKPREQARLTVSKTAFGTEAQSQFAASSNDDKLASVREQEIVLRNRVAELSVTVVRMQQEQIETLAAEVERLKAEVRAAQIAQRQAQETARLTPWTVFAQWVDAVWPIVIAGLAIGALGIGIRVWRRQVPPSMSVQTEPSIMASAVSKQNAEPTDWDGHDPNSTEMLSVLIRNVPAVGAKPLNNETAQPTAQEQEFERDVADYAVEPRIK